MKEPKAMVREELKYLRRGKAPKRVMKHEEEEAGMRHGGKVKKMADGGYAGPAPNPCPPGTTYLPGRGCVVNEYDQAPGLPPQTPPIEPEEFERRVRGTREGMMGGRRMAKGGVAGSYRRAADGIASKGKTKGKQIKMNKGGYC